MANKLNFRLAGHHDIDSIKKLGSVPNYDENSMWFVCEKDKNIQAFLSILYEKEHKLCKIFSLWVDSSLQNVEEVSKKILLFTIEHLAHLPISPDVLYTTTRTLTPYQQKLTLELGFKTLGIFPNAPGLDAAGINGLTAYFFNDVLHKKRYSSFSIHPLIEPIYEIARTECGLKKLPVTKNIQPETSHLGGGYGVQILEAICAPEFVKRRFEILEQKKAVSIDFYPFQKPNMLITNPEQNIEIFVKTVQKTGFAAIIAERIDAYTNPVTLYTKVAEILQSMNVSYIEVINDAADTWTIDCILKAGFVPCAYFPCLKKHASTRRDYVVFSKSFKKFFQDSLITTESYPAAYIKYLEQYRKIENKEL